MPKIQVIGESCKDIFVYCEAVRLAPDLPVPVLQELRTETNPGMAANVYRNIVTQIASCEIITNENWETITKTRYVHDQSNHLFLRVDKPHIIKPFNLANLVLDSEILVISDYNKGFLSESIIEQICELHPLVFLDTKKILGSWAQKAAFIKINHFEFLKSQPFVNSVIMDKLIHTRGSEGSDFRGENYPVERVEVRDTSGAGDSFIAALVCEFLSSRDIIQSIRAANRAGSKVVRTRGVGVM